MALASLLVIALVSWSLHLMTQALERQEFSLMLAGCLVAASAAATVGVCFLMGNYFDYVSHLPSVSPVVDDAANSALWLVQVDDAELLPN
ncbi:MAG: hypothetical protein NZ772_07665 [Cyanobacteria bacterium]|nr:hypothetical protein [Cyanobacteriota bacterium]MDW8201388.1 hypothetical protein [Cyanobacteriota bacterium SKYGB_h_bin112]